MWGAYVGSDVSRQSLRFFWLEACTQEEMPFVAGTYSKILEFVAKAAREGARIRLGCEVVRIVGSEHGSGSAKIEVADGTEESFDAVVVTCPLGWLKRNQDAFRPALPEDLSRAIGNIGYGTLDKVYITFPSAFWDGPDSAQTNGVDPECETQPSSTSEDTPEPDPSDWLFLSPIYAESTNPQNWNQECLSLTALPPPCAHSTLLFYTFGDCSTHIAHLATTSNPSERETKILNFFKPYYSLLPNYSPNNPACSPKAVLASAWAQDKFAGYGSYCNFPVGIEHADRDVERIRYGLPERGVWFAGEHTAGFENLGTTQGAYLSGERVARRILRAKGVGVWKE